MTDKKFKVRSTKTGQIATIQGKDLASALQHEGLNPSIWVLSEQPDSPPEENFGKTD